MVMVSEGRAFDPPFWHSFFDGVLWSLSLLTVLNVEHGKMKRVAMPVAVILHSSVFAPIVFVWLLLGAASLFSSCNTL